MTKEELIEAFLENPVLFRSLSLSKSQTKLVKYVMKRGNVTSKEVSSKFNISIQHSSTTLTRLYKKGYLSRVNTGDITGGIEYMYCSI